MMSRSRVPCGRSNLSSALHTCGFYIYTSKCRRSRYLESARAWSAVIWRAVPAIRLSRERTVRTLPPIVPSTLRSNQAEQRLAWMSPKQRRSICRINMNGIGQVMAAAVCTAAFLDGDTMHSPEMIKDRSYDAAIMPSGLCSNQAGLHLFRFRTDLGQFGIRAVQMAPILIHDADEGVSSATLSQSHSARPLRVQSPGTEADVAIGYSRPLKTTVAEAIRLDHRGGLIVELRTSQLRECPVIFHLCFQAAIARWRFPLKGFLGDSVVAPFEKLPCCTSGRWMHYNVKECGHVPTNKSLTVGATLGSGARCLRIQMPHLEYRSKSIAASFWLSPFPLRNQRTPQC